jgi:predicted Zn-dependent protease
MSSAQGSRDALAKALGDTSLPVVQAAAVALTSLGDARGVEALERLAADKRFSHLVTVQYSLAIQKMRMKDPAGAIPVLQKVLALTPYHADASVMLADALLRTGRRPEARTRLEDALRFDPQHKSAAQRLQAMDAQAR